MIHLDIDLLYLTDHFDVGTRRLKDYGDKSIEEIMKLEAESGNTKAQNFDLSVLSDPAKLIKIFKLMKPRNRWKILKNMSQDDLKTFMKYLDKEDLLLGLNFFSRDKLLELVEQLPKDKLALVTLTKFPPQKFLQMIPEEELDKFFDSSKIKPDQVMKSLQMLPIESLQGLMENITGQSADKSDKASILQTVGSLSPDKFKKSIQSMDKKSKQQLIFLMTKEDPKLFLEFSTDAFMFPMKTLDKPDIVKCMDVLENEDLLKMMDELPEELMAVVASQINPEIFAQLLCNQFQDVLSQIATV